MQKKADTSMLRRLRVVAVVLGALCFVAVVVQLYRIQIIGYEEYQQKAVSQQTRDKILYPKRGTIYDTNMRPLAISADTQLVSLEAVNIDSDAQGEAIIKALSEILELDPDFVRQKVESRGTYTIIKRGVEEEVADQIRAFIKEYNAAETAKQTASKEAGGDYKAEKIESTIFLTPDATRYYPYGNFLSHVLGFVGTDQQGLDGIEKTYDNVLTGTPGRVVTAANARGDSMAEEYEMQHDPVDGHNLVLTIDEVLQRVMEKNLEIAYNDNKVQVRATGIILDVNTGGILAMGSYPDYNPNAPFTLTNTALAEEIAQIEDDVERAAALSDARYAQWRNAAISDTYYAGSTFKIIPAAISLEENAVSLHSHFYCSGGKMVEGWEEPIKCWYYPRAHGDQTLMEAIQHSCNPAFIEIGQAIGWTNMAKYHSAFGLDVKTGIDLPGEASGNWFLGRPNLVDLATGSFGQNFPITPLQLITAVGAVANGGTLLRPHVVKEVRDGQGNVIESYSREEVRQVISAETSALMNEILESVVTIGTGKNAYTAGYRVAGKTGTTEKIGIGGKDKRISSFIAYAPADNPQIAVLILLDEPTVMPVTGGLTVAPVVRRVMEEILPYLDVEAHYNEGELTTVDVTVPDLAGLTKAEADEALKAAGLSARTEGAGDTVTDQVPAAGAVVADTAKVILFMGGTAPESVITMPDLSGMTLEKAKSTLSSIGLFYRVTGLINTTEGRIVVTRQSAEKDTQVTYGTVITIELSDLDQQVT